MSKGKRNPIAKAPRLPQLRQKVIPGVRRAEIQRVVMDRIINDRGYDWLKGSANDDINLLAACKCATDNEGWSGADVCQMRGTCPFCQDWARKVVEGDDE